MTQSENPKNSSWKAGLVLWVLTLATLVGACSFGSGNESDTTSLFANDLSAVKTAADLREELRSLYEPDPEVEIVVQEEISKCMAREGFDYIPYVDEPFEEVSATPVTDAFERDHGFTQRLPSPSDPNAAIRAELEIADPGAALVYQETLWGRGGGLPVEAPENGYESLDLSLEALGCWNFTANRLRGGLTRLEYTDSLGKLAGNLENLIQSDERYTTAEANFELCLQELDVESMRLAADEESIRLGNAIPVDADREQLERFRPDVDRLRQAEIAIYEAEASCDEAELSDLEEELADLYFDEALEASQID